MTYSDFRREQLKREVEYEERQWQALNRRQYAKYDKAWSWLGFVTCVAIVILWTVVIVHQIHLWRIK